MANDRRARLQQRELPVLSQWDVEMDPGQPRRAFSFARAQSRVRWVLTLRHGLVAIAQNGWSRVSVGDENRSKRQVNMTNLASLRPRSKGDWLMRLASVRQMPLRPVSQCHSGPVSGSTFVSTLLRANLRERCAMTEQEIEHVAGAIYLVRVAPRASRENGASCPLRLVAASKRMPSPRSRRSTN
jgi:hypothetical protein